MFEAAPEKVYTMNLVQEWSCAAAILSEKNKVFLEIVSGKQQKAGPQFTYG